MDKKKAVEEFFEHCVHAKIRDSKNPFEFAELEHEGWNDKAPNGSFALEADVK